MEIKAFPLKAIEGSADAGTFEAVVSVFGNVDAYGDRVEPGAFADSLAKSLPPIVWSHRWDEPPIGAALEARETEEGLLVKAKLLLEENETARKVYAAMTAADGNGNPPLREFSFAYDVLDAAWVTEDEVEIYSLKRLDLIEVGPCLKGVNDQTRLVGVKGIERVRPSRPSEGAESSTNSDAYRKARDLLTMTVPPIKLDTSG